MLRSILKCHKIFRKNLRSVHHNNESVALTKPTTPEAPITYELIEEKSIENAIRKLSEEEPKSVLAKCEEDVSHIAPYLKPSFNLAAYVNKSDTLQELLKLGVNLYKLEKQDQVPQYILGLEFERDIKEHVIFLHSLGLQVYEIGEFITRNPLIFKESLDDLRTRINYLKYKKFNDEMILRIVSANARWLQFSTQDIDTRLGFFQNYFSLTGDQVRALAVKQPKIITYNLDHIKVNTFVVREEMGFSSEEVKLILLEKPGIFMKSQEKILKTFEYLHKTMQIPLEDIAKSPEILTYREHRLKERYLFLRKLNRVQFDPKKPNYTSLLSIVAGTDSHFATEVAKSSIQAYNEFLKTL